MAVKSRALGAANRRITLRRGKSRRCFHAHVGALLAQNELEEFALCRERTRNEESVPWIAQLLSAHGGGPRYRRAVWYVK